MRPEDRKSDLLSHTARLLVEEGSDGLTMEAVARRAGVNRALTYYYFSSKDNLLVELFEDRAGRFDDRVNAAVEAAPDLEAKLLGILRVWMDDLDEHGAVLSALHQASTDSGALEARRKERLLANGGRIADLLTSELDLTDGDAVVAATALMSAAQGLVLLWQTGAVNADEVRAHFVTFGLGGLEAMARRAVKPR